MDSEASSDRVGTTELFGAPRRRPHGSVVTPGQGVFWELPPTEARSSELRSPTVAPEVEAILVNEVEDDVDVVLVGETRIEPARSLSLSSLIGWSRSRLLKTRSMMRSEFRRLPYRPLWPALQTLSGNMKLQRVGSRATG